MFQHHPDLTDARWAKKAEKRALRAVRKAGSPSPDKRFRASRKARTTSPGGKLRPPRAGTFRDPVPAERAIRDRTIILVVVVLIGALLLAKHPWSGTPPRTQTQTTARRSQPLDLTHPFARTPAAHWQDGEAGIVPPAARQTGPYTATQVATAVRQAKQVLVTAHLDPKILFNHDVSGYLALLAPQAQAGERQQQQHSPNLFGRISLLAKGFQLLPVPVKVDGSMSVSVDRDGALVVHTNYVFAFPFAPEHPDTITEPWQIIAVQHVVEDFDAADDGLYPARSGAYTDAIACTAYAHGYLAPAYSEPTASTDTRSPESVYDPKSSIDIPSGCPGR
jgi:hypothetical protein